MVTAKSTRRQPGGNPPIVSRDTEGAEHLLAVTSHACLIAIEDDLITRVLTPAAAAELVMALLHELGGRLVPPAGPLTGVM